MKYLTERSVLLTKRELKAQKLFDVLLDCGLGVVQSGKIVQRRYKVGNKFINWLAA